MPPKIRFSGYAESIRAVAPGRIQTSLQHPPEGATSLSRPAGEGDEQDFRPQRSRLTANSSAAILKTPWTTRLSAGIVFSLPTCRAYAREAQTSRADLNIESLNEGCAGSSRPVGWEVKSGWRSGWPPDVESLVLRHSRSKPRRHPAGVMMMDSSRASDFHPGQLSKPNSRENGIGRATSTDVDGARLQTQAQHMPWRISAILFDALAPAHPMKRYRAPDGDRPAGGPSKGKPKRCIDRAAGPCHHHIRGGHQREPRADHPFRFPGTVPADPVKTAAIRESNRSTHRFTCSRDSPGHRRWRDAKPKRRDGRRKRRKPCRRTDL